MRVLIDTNIMLDVLMGRQPYFDLADRIIRLCADQRIEGYMAAPICSIFSEKACRMRTGGKF